MGNVFGFMDNGLWKIEYGKEEIKRKYKYKKKKWNNLKKVIEREKNVNKIYYLCGRSF